MRCIDEGLFKIPNLLHGAIDGRRDRSKLHAPSPKFGTAICLLLPSRLFMSIFSYTKTTLQ